MALANSDHNMKMYFLDANIEDLSCVKSPHVSTHFVFLMHLVESVCRQVPLPQSSVKNAASGIFLTLQR